MTTAYLLTAIPSRELDTSGNPVSGSKLHTWVAGAPGTMLATFADSAGTVPLPNPIVADIGGHYPEIWVTSDAYFLEARKADDATVLWQRDNVTAANVSADKVRADLANPAVSFGSKLVAFMQRVTGAVARWVEDKLSERISVKDFGALGDDAHDSYAAFVAALSYAGTVAQSLPAGLSSSSCTVHVPAGIYRLSACPVVPDGVHLMGDGAGSTVLKATGAGVALAMGNGTDFCANTRVSDLKIIGAYTETGTLGSAFGQFTTTTTVGLQVNKCIRSCSVERVTIACCTVDLQTVGSFALLLDSVYCTYAINNAFLSDNFSTSAARKCRFEWAETGAVVKIDGTVNETVGGVFDSCSIQIGAQDGVLLYDVTSFTFMGECDFEANYHTAPDAVTHAYADVRIIKGPNSRGKRFVVAGFFTPGSSPNIVGAYCAVKSDTFEVLDASGVLVRDSRYYAAVDVLAATSGCVLAAGMDVTGTASKVLYNPAQIDRFIRDQNGNGQFEISKLRAGGLAALGYTGGASNATDGHLWDFNVSTAGGARTIGLRDDEAQIGAFVWVSKTSADANALTVATVKSDGVTPSTTHTIAGAASVSSTTQFKSWCFGFNGTAWYIRSQT